MIHTNRVVTVGDQESIIDKPIVLYRGDREVEVEFELVGNEFMFTTEGNVIKSVNASHGQLVLNTPSGDHMFSELAECHDGKVVFVITKEMIDEFIEIGFYSFQIRLYDGEQMKSRVTIPPVFSGLDIRNPIAAEDETNVVDQAVVDYARIYRDQSNEELPTFDWAGNYIKTDWVHHDVITENKMNKIEDGLWTINNKISESDNVFLKKAEQMEVQRQNDVNELNSKDTQLTNDIQNVNRTLTNAINKVKVDMEVGDASVKNELTEYVEGELAEVNSQLEYGVNGVNIDLAWGIEQNTDQTVKIQNEINGVADNTVLNFTGKNYIIKGLTINNKKNVKIVGYNSVLMNDDSSKNIFNFVDCENITIEGFNVECTWTNFKNDTVGQFISCSNSKNIAIKNNTIHRGGLTITDCENVTICNNVLADTTQLNNYPVILRNNIGICVTNNKINNARIDGVKITGNQNGNSTEKIVISNNIIWDCYYDAIDMFSGGYKAVISNNVLSGCEKGVHVKAWGGYEADYSVIEGYSKDIIIDANQIYNCRHQCVWIGCDNVMVTNNMLSDTDTGIYIMEGKNGNIVKNISINNNTIKNITTRAVESMANVENIRIQNNYIENITNGFAVRILSMHSIIDNNTFMNPGSRGITISSNRENDRIYIANNKIINMNTPMNFGIIVTANNDASSMVYNNIVVGATTPYQGSVTERSNSWNNFIDIKSQTFSRNVNFNDITTTGTLTTINLTHKGVIRKINIKGMIQSTTKSCIGFYDSTNQICHYTFGDSGTNQGTNAYCICFADNTSNRIFGKIQNITNTSFDIYWSVTGSIANSAAIVFNIEYY